MVFKPVVYVLHLVICWPATKFLVHEDDDGCTKLFLISRSGSRCNTEKG